MIFTLSLFQFFSREKKYSKKDKCNLFIELSLKTKIVEWVQNNDLTFYFGFAFEIKKILFFSLKIRVALREIQF